MPQHGGLLSRQPCVITGGAKKRPLFGLCLVRYLRIPAPRGVSGLTVVRIYSALIKTRRSSCLPQQPAMMCEV